MGLLDSYWTDWKTVAGPCLLHDVQEAYISDIPSPFKQLPIFDGYRNGEDSFQRLIFRSHAIDPIGYNFDNPDKALASLEMHELKSIGCPNDQRHWKAEGHYDHYHGFGWSPFLARVMFQYWYDIIFDKEWYCGNLKELVRLHEGDYIEYEEVTEKIYIKDILL